MNNPYIGIIKSIRGTKPTKLSAIGEVISASPLQIAYNGIVLGKADIYIAADLQLNDGDLVCVMQDKRFIVLCKITEVE